MPLNTGNVNVFCEMGRTFLEECNMLQIKIVMEIVIDIFGLGKSTARKKTCKTLTSD
jgi:hypothetical protein